MRTREPLLELSCFAHVGREEARLLLRNTEIVRLPVGHSVLLSHGPAQEMLVVVRGQLQSLREQWSAGPGSALGAHALLTRTEPTGFRATEPALVAYVSVAQARALMAGSPAFATAVAVSLSSELARRDQGQRAAAHDCRT